MASGPITLWQIDGETVADFIFLGYKITADGDCSHEIRRHFILGRKVMTNLDSILQSRDITLSTKVCLFKAMVFPVVMYGCESWTIRKAENWRIDAFELWCWRRLLRVPLTARRSNQSILEEIILGVHWKDWYWSWNSKSLATRCKEPIHLKRPWCWERLRAGEGDNRERDSWMASPTQWTGAWWTVGVGDEQGGLACCGSWGHKESDMTEWLNWTELNHKWVLNFVNSFLCLHWDYHMIFMFQFVNMVYHVDWFAYIEEALYPWNKPNSIVVYELFSVLLNSVC